MRRDIKQLPPSMAERAIKSRKLATQNPSSVDIDDNFLPWVYDEDHDYWISFDGNYSNTGPAERRARELDKEKSREEWGEQAEAKIRADFEHNMKWSRIRHEVLSRDKHTCQVCNKVGNSKLHVHHILKRAEGGSDFLDNLITVCPGCHKRADTKLYNPDWV